MKKLLLGLLVFGFTTQFMFSQEIELAEVHLDVNYKYLEAIDSKHTPIDVKNLEKEAAFYNIKEADVYSDEYDNYRVYFYIPKGSIFANYDSNGKILQTIERFENIQLPRSIVEAVAQEYPDWTIAEDAYKVDYYGKSGIAQKQFKVKLKKENKSKTLKFNEDGEFL